MLNIPQSTAYLCVFKAYLASDHVTEATGKTIAITISKNGGAFGNPNAGATNATEITSGWYKVSLDTTDTNTVGPLAIRGAVATIDDVGTWVNVVKATNGGMTALPDTACTTNASLITSGTGTAQISLSSGQVLQQAGTGAGQLDFTSGVVKANVTQLLGTAWLAPGTAGTPDVNTKLWNGLATVALPLIPTVAGRTLDCSAGGEAGVDWANVGSPTTSLALTGTTIATTQKVDIETIKTNPVVNAGTVTFPTTATLASTTNITAGTITTVTNLTNAPTAGDLTATMKTSVTTAATAATPTVATVTSVTNAVGVTSNIKKNSASRITFVMTDSTTHAPKTGCTVTAQVSLDGAALVSCTNSPSEISSGLYTLVLAAADTNANELAYRLTASSADDLVIERVTQP